MCYFSFQYSSEEEKEEEDLEANYAGYKTKKKKVTSLDY